MERADALTEFHVPLRVAFTFLRVVWVCLLNNIVHMVHMHPAIAFDGAEKPSELVVIEETVVIRVPGVVEIIYARAVALNCVPEKSELVL